MIKDLELLKCYHCGQTYRFNEDNQKNTMVCSGCGLKAVPLITGKIAERDSKGFYVLLGFFAIVALLGALGSIMLIHGWNLWVTFVLVGGIVYIICKIFMVKYRIIEISEYLSDEMVPYDSGIKSTTDFDRLVVNAINELPQCLKARLSNVSVVVEDKPNDDILRKLRLMPNTSLLGLFEGVPMNKRSVWHSGILPERITIFQKNIEAVSRSDKDIKRRIKKVIRHEVAHFVGFSEEEIKKMGY